MRTRSLFFSLVAVCTLIVVGLLVLVKRFLLNGNSIAAVGCVIAALFLVVLFGYLINKYRVDVMLCMPFHDDERSYKVKMYAAGYAYFISIYVWLAILIFRDFLDRDDIILTGLLGMAVSFGLSWLILNNKKGLE